MNTTLVALLIKAGDAHMELARYYRNAGEPEKAKLEAVVAGALADTAIAEMLS